MTDDARTVILDHDEAAALALRMVAYFIREDDGWLTWEDVPNLDQDSFELLIDAVRDVALDLTRMSNTRDRSTDIDSQYLWERAS